MKSQRKQKIHQNIGNEAEKKAQWAFFTESKEIKKRNVGTRVRLQGPKRKPSGLSLQCLKRLKNGMLVLEFGFMGRKASPVGFLINDMVKISRTLVPQYSVLIFSRRNNESPLGFHINDMVKISRTLVPQYSVLIFSRRNNESPLGFHFG